MNRTQLAILAIILLSFGVAFYFYPQMPERMASHWNAKGQVDSYMAKSLALFLMPVISVILAVLFLLIPKIDPLKENIKKFRKYFDIFIVLILLFLFYIYLLTIIWNSGVEFNMTYAMIPPMVVLFYYIGILVENAKRNWFIGIRTPWTLSSEKVWDETHKMGGKLFKTAALVGLLGFLFTKYAIYFVILPVLAVAVYTVIYSYLRYQKHLRRK